MSVDRGKIEQEAIKAVVALKGPALGMVIKLVEEMADDSLLGCTKPHDRDRTCRYQGEYAAYNEVLKLLRGEATTARVKEANVHNDEALRS